MDVKDLTVPRRTVFCLLIGGLFVLGSPAPTGMAQSQAEPVRGELKIEGTHIARLILQRDDGHSEEWSNLSGSILLPVGTYHIRQLSLRGEYVGQSQGLTKLGQIEVTKDEPAVLKAGGPLQQVVEIRRQGRMLVLSYRVQGIGGEEYGPSRWPDSRAKFTAYQGKKAIATGDFEYG